MATTIKHLYYYDLLKGKRCKQTATKKEEEQEIFKIHHLFVLLHLIRSFLGVTFGTNEVQRKLMFALFYYRFPRIFHVDDDIKWNY